MTKSEHIERMELLARLTVIKNELKEELFIMTTRMIAIDKAIAKLFEGGVANG